MMQTAGAPATASPAATSALSPQQIAYFETFGFVHLPGLFREDMDWIVEAFEEVFANEGHPRMETYEHLHLAQRRIIIPGFITRSEKLTRLLEDPRVLGVVSSLIGPNWEYAESDGNLFFCESSWHPDTYAAPLHQFHIKLSFYLDPLTAESGAIRMIPGSNHPKTPYTRLLRRNLEDHTRVPEIYGVDHKDIPSWPLASEPGDLIVWNFRTIHASFNGGERRRLFSINFREKTSEDATASA